MTCQKAACALEETGITGGWRRKMPSWSWLTDGNREEGRVFGDKDRHLVLNDEISRGVCREGYTAKK